MSREMYGAVAFEDENLIDKKGANPIWADSLPHDCDFLFNHHCSIVQRS